MPQLISVVAAYLVQAPYVYVTDAFLMSIPSSVVLTVILPKLLVEDVVSALLAHLILFRLDLTQLLE